MPAYGKKRVKVAQWWECHEDGYHWRCFTLSEARHDKMRNFVPIRIVKVTRYRMVKQ